MFKTWPGAVTLTALLFPGPVNVMTGFGDVCCGGGGGIVTGANVWIRVWIRRKSDPNFLIRVRFRRSDGSAVLPSDRIAL